MVVDIAISNLPSSTMGASIKPIILYSHPTGPNPWKVAMILEELGLPYRTIVVDKADLKKAPYEEICINGRAPAITDPNTGITLWESGAIIEYLVDRYDVSHTISYPAGTPRSFYAKQWLYFQVSGQGPYFGQAMWFVLFHPEKILSAQERYVNEIRRVSRVLDRALEGQDWLVGDKCSYADISFLPWYESVSAKILVGVVDLTTEYPNLHKWLNRIRERPAVSKTLVDKAARASGIK